MEAVKRAVAAPCIGSDEVASAREVLKPIRELHQELCVGALDEDAEVEHGMRLVLDALAPLIYSTEELMGGAR
ncbi:hypothetical protein JKJ01_27700 [Mycolicibacterium fortuitum]|nr:hypothetical protein [Mycolicibacterium fortuitum]